MATLTETAYLARKGVNISIIFFICLIVFRILFIVGSGLLSRFFPAPPPAPTLAFGKLPRPNFQNNIATPSAITYSLETVDGTLPVIPPTMKVYFMPTSGASFGSFDKMKNQAALMGFQAVPQKVDSTTWHFIDSENPLRALDIDEVSGNFHLTYNFLSDLSLFNEKNFSTDDQIIAQATGFLNNLSLLPDNLKSGQQRITYLKLDSGNLIPTTSISNADAVAVSFNRVNIDDYPVLPPDVKQGLVSVLYSGSQSDKKKILEARYFYRPVDLENWATYPLIKASAAYNELKAGHGLIASLPKPFNPAIVIRKVYLAYLDPYPLQSYLQPILVFSDEKGFLAYIPLVSPEWEQ